MEGVGDDGGDRGALLVGEDEEALGKLGSSEKVARESRCDVSREIFCNGEWARSLSAEWAEVFCLGAQNNLGREAIRHQRDL